MKLLNECIIFASQIFNGQTDRGGSPYILHCLRIMISLQLDKRDIDVVLAGLLHDALEQGVIIENNIKRKVTSQDLFKLGCSKKTIRLVEGLTKIEGQTQEQYKAIILSDIDLMHIKYDDLKDNINLDRLKNITEKDLIRNQQYNVFINEIYLAMTREYNKKRSKHFSKGTT